MRFKEAAYLKTVFQKIQHVSDSEMEDLWDNYLEFMVVKALCHDRGSHKGMLFSTTTLMDELWHCHILESSLYDDFMKLVKRVNPMMDKIHHSSGLSLNSEADKLHRRNSTATAYRYASHFKECTNCNCANYLFIYLFFSIISGTFSARSANGSPRVSKIGRDLGQYLHGMRCAQVRGRQRWLNVQMGAERLPRDRPSSEGHFRSSLSRRCQATPFH